MHFIFDKKWNKNKGLTRYLNAGVFWWPNLQFDEIRKRVYEAFTEGLREPRGLLVERVDHLLHVVQEVYSVAVGLVFRCGLPDLKHSRPLV